MLHNTSTLHLELQPAHCGMSQHFISFQSANSRTVTYEISSENKNPL